MIARLDKIYNSVLTSLISVYDGGREDLEFLFNVNIVRCVHAERDHMKERRVYSHVGCSKLTICVSSSIDLLPDENIKGILVHEIGHLIHINCPGTVDGIEILEDIDDDEIIADAIIDQVFGIHIYYDENKVQCVVQ